MKNSLSQKQQLSKLKWYCRRGVKELDLVLGNYLEKHYENASQIDKEAFKNLLEMEDSTLLDMLTGNVQITNEIQLNLITKMRTCK